MSTQVRLAEVGSHTGPSDRTNRCVPSGRAIVGTALQCSRGVLNHIIGRAAPDHGRQPQALTGWTSVAPAPTRAVGSSQARPVGWLRLVGFGAGPTLSRSCGRD